MEQVILGLPVGQVNTSYMTDDRWFQPGHPGLNYLDWQDLGFRKGLTQNHQISASGATDYVRYYVSGNYTRQEGMVINTWFQSQGKAVQGGLTIRPVAVDLLNAYDAKDTRKAFTIQSGYVYNGVAETQSFFKKYVDLTKVPTNRVDWPINFIVYRYTDILMMKAECILKGATGTQAEVDAIVNLVRTRAGLAATTNITLTQLLKERRLEFAAEGSRWHDLVRFGVVDTAIPAWITTEDVQKKMLPFQKNYIIYPVPQTELDVKPGLYTQNAGY